MATPRMLIQRAKTVIGVKPQNTVAATVTGEIVDRLGFNSALVAALTAAHTSNPSAWVLGMKLYHDSDPAMGTPVDTGVVFTSLGITDTVTAVDEQSVDLMPFNRYLRLVIILAFTGGMGPTLDLAATIVLGDHDKNEPVV